MRIHGKGETWTIDCTAEEVAMILVSLKKNTDLDLDEALLEMTAGDKILRKILFPRQETTK